MFKTKEKIIAFVRQTLGCTCPEDVFELIEVADLEITGLPKLNSIKVGGKLLIYIWEVHESTEVCEILHLVLQAGVEQRLQLAFNRLRIVLVTNEFEGVTETAKPIFDHFTQGIDRIHLHVVQQEEVHSLAIDPKRFGLPARTVLDEIDDKTLAIVIQRKSRIIMAGANKFIDKAKKIQNVRPDVRVMLKTSTPICSKSTAFLAQNGIKIVDC